MLKKIIISLIPVIAIAATPSYALDDPNKCPSVESMRSISFNHVEKEDENSQWLVSTETAYKYDTNVDWHVVTYADAKDEAEALQKANSLLNLVQFVDGPAPFGRAWLCMYQNEDDMVMAISGMDDSKLMKKLMYKKR